MKWVVKMAVVRDTSVWEIKDTVLSFTLISHMLMFCNLWFCRNIHPYLLYNTTNSLTSYNCFTDRNCWFCYNIFIWGRDIKRWAFCFPVSFIIYSSILSTTWGSLSFYLIKSITFNWSSSLTRKSYRYSFKYLISVSRTGDEEPWCIHG